MILVGRVINGISINGLEFLLKDEGEDRREFNTVEDAKGFMREVGCPENEIDTYQYVDKETGEWH